MLVPQDAGPTANEPPALPSPVSTNLPVLVLSVVSHVRTGGDQDRFAAFAGTARSDDKSADWSIGCLGRIASDMLISASSPNERCAAQAAAPPFRCHELAAPGSCRHASATRSQVLLFGQSRRRQCRQRARTHSPESDAAPRALAAQPTRTKFAIHRLRLPRTRGPGLPDAQIAGSMDVRDGARITHSH